eukprot:354288-Chlamydomonas_euryale.AAC.4
MHERGYGLDGGDAQQGRETLVATMGGAFGRGAAGASARQPRAREHSQIETKARGKGRGGGREARREREWQGTRRRRMAQLHEGKQWGCFPGTPVDARRRRAAMRPAYQSQAL